MQVGNTSWERWNGILSVLGPLALFFYLRRASIDTSGTPGGEFLVRALNSWFLRARWSADAKSRMKSMAYASLLLAIVMLLLLVLDLMPRYTP